MPEKMGRTDSVLYTIGVGKMTVDECLRHSDKRMREILRREWLVTIGATLDVARAEIERLRARVAELEESLKLERDRPRDE